MASESSASIKYVHTAGLGPLLERLRISLFVSTYQGGKLIVVRSRSGKVSTLLRSFDQPMGLAVDNQRLVVGTRNQIWFLENVAEAAQALSPPGQYDACYVPRRCHVTGDVRMHELGWLGDRLCFVNTRFSCLCTVHSAYSFNPFWQPHFIATFDDQDRCHLNGLALANGEVRFATALGTTDSPAGWRETKVNGGCLVDVRRNRIVATGLCMPHSPRVRDETLLVLNSGRGELLSRQPGGDFEVLVGLPGYARGLALVDEYAFVGVSKIRETSTFGGLPLLDEGTQLRCGVWVADLNRGEVIELLEFTSGVEEIFDVQSLKGICFPAVIGFEKPEINSIFVIPSSTRNPRPRVRPEGVEE